MQVTTLLSLALCAFVSAAPLQKPHAARLVPPDASLVFAEISAISGDVSTLNSEVNAYNGTTSTTLVSHFEYLVNSLKTATVDTSSSAPFTETESESISNAISALSSSAISLLQDLDAKVATVAAAGDTSVVESALITLQSAADDFLTAVTDQVIESETSAIDTSADEINYAFNQAIETF